MNRHITVLTTLALVVCVASSARAQFGPSLRGSGLAGAYAGLALGHETVDWNPALLGINTSPLLSMGLPRVNLAGTTLGPTWMEMFDVLREQNELSDTERLDFLGKIPGDGIELRGDLQVPWFGLSMGPFAFGTSTTLLASGNVGREFLDLLLYARQYGGVDPAKLTEYRVGDTSGREAAYTTFKLGYGHSLDSALTLPFPVSVGVTARYVLGHSVGRTRIFEPNVDIFNQDITVAALAVTAPSGTGYGLDVGIAARPMPGLKLSLAVDNLVQSMSWTEELEVRGDVVAGSELGDLEVGDLADRFEARPLDPATASPEASLLAHDITGEAHFPRVVRAGASYRVGGTALGATMSTRQGSGDLHVGWPTYLAVGVEQTLPMIRILALRGGLASSLSGANALSGGASLRLGPVHIAGAVSRTSGHADPINGSPRSARFADRLAAGSGYSASLGLELLRF